MEPTDEATRAWYSRYYREKGVGRNDLLNNPQVLFQHLAFEKSMLQTLRAAHFTDRTAVRVLDVGCGNGGSLLTFLALGFAPSNLVGVDILDERIKEARTQLPGVRFERADATSLHQFETDSFDLAIESTMFVQITGRDSEVARRIAAEMLRVTRPGGHVLLVDWRYSKPGNSNYLGMSLNRVRNLFDLPASGEIVHRSRGALIPPVGRFLSKYLPSLYFPVAALLPFLVGQTATLIRKG